MFRDFFAWVLNAMNSCFSMLRYFILDEAFKITLFHFFVAVIFFRLSVRIVDIIKSVNEFNKQDSPDFQKERRYKK